MLRGQTEHVGDQPQRHGRCERAHELAGASGATHRSQRGSPCARSRATAAPCARECLRRDPALPAVLRPVERLHREVHLEQVPRALGCRGEQLRLLRRGAHVRITRQQPELVRRVPVYRVSRRSRVSSASRSAGSVSRSLMSNSIAPSAAAVAAPDRAEHAADELPPDRGPDGDERARDPRFALLGRDRADRAPGGNTKARWVTLGRAFSSSRETSARSP